jgi:hypothetical protein
MFWLQFHLEGFDGLMNHKKLAHSPNQFAHPEGLGDMERA